MAWIYRNVYLICEVIMVAFNFAYRYNDAGHVYNEIYNAVGTSDTLYYSEIKIINQHALEGAFEEVSRPDVCFDNLTEIREYGASGIFRGAYVKGNINYNVFPALKIIKAGGLYQAFENAVIQSSISIKFPNLERIEDAGELNGGLQQLLYGADFTNIDLRFPKLNYIGEKAFMGAFRNTKGVFNLYLTGLTDHYYIANNAFNNAFTNSDSIESIIHYSSNLSSHKARDFQKYLRNKGYNGKVKV